MSDNHKLVKTLLMRVRKDFYGQEKDAFFNIDV